ncbi:histidine phosphatase family protein [Cohnella lubricantis]|uniref:Histidine phosphatase family protein n=1 Tax=Cohnella lubricantis TaxID=2163172 RepID=A0A841THF1_9BACL|nr:histidine phosphatase family protein [Cohnella lubricantis]MBB6677881.1 histidine phosphatase family protein [Cohnella lubricantis]MBP2119063.1 broad specificity phosphatase PhoE [Cohnella lubricantis]
MNIALVRHFKVQPAAGRKWLAPDQFRQWTADYDRAELEVAPLPDDGTRWDVCLCSDLSRAVRTASVIYPGTAIRTPHLREIELHPVMRSGVKLHLNLWLLLARMAWLVSHPSQEETKAKARERARLFVDVLERDYPNRNVLVVSHGAFMRLLAKELTSRGCKGEGFLVPRNGELYVYKR